MINKGAKVMRRKGYKGAKVQVKKAKKFQKKRKIFAPPYRKKDRLSLGGSVRILYYYPTPLSV